MRTKSILLTPVLLFLSFVLIFSIVQAASGSAVAWLGAALAAAPLPLTVSFMMATERLARTSENLPGAIAASFVGVILAATSLSTNALPALLALISVSALLWYVFSYSRFGRTDSRTVTLGERLPAFTLETADGAAVTEKDFAGAPSLFLFYRGNWCPLCMAQIKEIAEDYKKLADLGVKVALVSPQPHDETRKLAAKFDAPFEFLVDKDFRTAKAFELFAEGGTPLGVDAMGYGQDTVLPTVIATDASGKVIFLDQTDNYRVRPEPSTFLKVFEDARIIQHTDPSPATAPAGAVA
ncbi:MAG: peroxiredoxin family protein [Pseudomonadota bacterium]